MSLISSILSLGAGIWGAKNAVKENKKMNQQLTNDQAMLDNLFKGEYYQNFMDRSDVQGALSNVRTQNRELGERAQNTAKVMGGTQESLTATQGALANAYGQTVNSLAANTSSWKGNLLNNYLNNRAILSDRTFAMYKNSDGFSKGIAMQGLSPFMGGK